MARTVRNAKIDTRSSRARLKIRREPYWTKISQGCAIGYRRGDRVGTWIAKFRDDGGKRHYEALGAADDAREPDGLSVFSFAQAQEKARLFFRDKAREAAGALNHAWKSGHVADDHAWRRVCDPSGKWTLLAFGISHRTNARDSQMPVSPPSAILCSALC
jgi:hypothetical protein